VSIELNDKVAFYISLSPIMDHIAKRRRAALFGHITRLSQAAPANQALCYTHSFLPLWPGPTFSKVLRKILGRFHILGMESQRRQTLHKNVKNHTFAAGGVTSCCMFS